VPRVRFVRQAKEVGFSLEEIRQIIEASHIGPPCTLTRKLIERHLAQVESELHRLRSLQGRLKRLLHQMPPEVTNRVCPLIDGDQISN
jgi:MerR family mercuric resistance operon transcriptional regulator